MRRAVLHLRVPHVYCREQTQLCYSKPPSRLCFHARSVGVDLGESKLNSCAQHRVNVKMVVWGTACVETNKVHNSKSNSQICISESIEIAFRDLIPEYIRKCTVTIYGCRLQGGELYKKKKEYLKLHWLNKSKPLISIWLYNNYTFY